MSTILLSDNAAPSALTDHYLECPDGIPARIQWMRRVLCLNMASLADLLGVERRRAYALLHGALPTSAENVLLAALGSQVEKISALCINRIDLVLSRPLFAGKSAIDLLREGIQLSNAQLIAMADIDSAEGTKRATRPARGYRAVAPLSAVDEVMPLMSA